MTPEQEIKVVELCKQFIAVSEEVNLTFLDLCRIRDKYFPIITGRSVQNPADLAKSIKVLEEHCKEMKAVLSQSMGVKADEGELVKGKKEDAKIQAATAVTAGIPVDPVLDKFIDDYEMGGPKTKWKVRKLIESARANGTLKKKEVAYLKEVAKGKPTEDFLAQVKVA